jgi:hypothetical protein
MLWTPGPNIGTPVLRAEMDVQILPLVPNAVLPLPARASTRKHIPPGYGVQEQCLPFTAATALGLIVPSPIDFGLCEPGNVPMGAHAFRSPVNSPRRADSRVFYVRDNPACRFVRNAFSFEPIPFLDSKGRQSMMRSVQPGISFFDRPDQQSLFKLHLPYVLRTPRAVDSLFTAAVNRDMSLTVLAGLVETDWYAHPVNLIIRKPELGALDVAAGDIVAQVVFIPREGRHANVRVLQPGSDDVHVLRGDLLKWYVSHAQDRSAYKRLARSHHGRTKKQQED